MKYHPGVLCCWRQVEVPLLYYFPVAEKPSTQDRRARAFVYEVRDDPLDASRQIVEIVVS